MKRLLLACLLLLGGVALAQKSFYLEDVVQEVFVGADGTVRVEDTRSLVLNGDFSENTYFVEIDPAPGGRVGFGDFEVLDNGPATQAEISGNEIAWRVRGANETRRFKFSYTLTNELEVATDIARLNRQILEPQHARIEGYTQVIYPPAASPDQFKVFIFNGSGRIGTLDFSANFNQATVQLDALFEDEPLRSDIFLDAALFTFRTIDAPREQQWLNEIEGQTEPFRRESERILRSAGRVEVSPLWFVLVWAGVASLGAWLTRAYTIHGREPRTPEVGPYYREPAEEIPPAAVPFLLTQSAPGLKAAGPAIAATLLDFARRGYLSIETEEKEGFLGIGRREEVSYSLEQEPRDLTPFEADLWKAFKGAARLGAQGRFDADDLRDYFESRPNFGSAWVKAPRGWYEKTHGDLLDAGSSQQAWGVSVFSFLAAGALGFTGFSMAANSLQLGIHLFAGAIVCAMFGVIAAASLRRWEPGKLLNAKRWNAYRNFLSDFSLMRESPADHYKLWDYHFIYATALGVSKKYLKNLQRLMSEHPDRFAPAPWLGRSRYPYGTQGRIPASMPGDIESLTRSLNTLSQIETNLGNLQTALSPKTDTGGGFSGGGGGFSGGGGGFSGGGSSGGGGGSGMR